MKRYLALLLIAFFGFQATAQETENETESESGLLRLRGCVGLYSTKDIYTSLNYSSANAWGKYSAANYFLDLSLYRYKMIEMGLALGFQSPQPKKPSYTYSAVYLDDNSLDVSYFTVLPQVRFNWIESDDKMFEMYSYLGLGITIANVTYNTPPVRDETFPLPAAHVSWIGLRFGQEFGGFIELGLGTKGLLAAGVSYRM